MLQFPGSTVRRHPMMYAQQAPDTSSEKNIVLVLALDSDSDSDPGAERGAAAAPTDREQTSGDEIEPLLIAWTIPSGDCGWRDWKGDEDESDRDSAKEEEWEMVSGTGGDVDEE